MKETYDIFQLLGASLEPSTKNAVLVIVAISIAFWKIFSIGHKEQDTDDKRLREVLELFYSPAIIYIKMRKRNLMTEKEFKDKFSELLIKYRGKVLNEIVLKEIDNCIDGVGDEYKLLSNLEAQEVWIRERLTREKGIKALSWMVSTYLNLMGLLAVLALVGTPILVAAFVLTKKISTTYGLFILCSIVVVVLVLLYIVARKRQQRIEKRSNELRAKYERELHAYAEKASI
ncbi:hypothetical protein [Tumebacillus flagellatus]|uniref:Uncharacterized protein n=1 Tax=Tumebacillus flagellatus TaxID=1157490 RepID=A0A074LWE2_9BACL|nr:hypothetical protein [Tumebacillus flagellatus]KEO84920.1 hypothetical protein EL26_02615 [Tumebacillus flagellatus]